MGWGEAARVLWREREARAGLCLLVLGELLILLRVRPFSDYYFPIAWFGFTFFLDAAVRAQTGVSLLRHARPVFLALIPLSALFWWMFEGFDLIVHNWSYVGGGPPPGPAFVAFASLAFSTVLPAVWCASRCVRCLLPGFDPPQWRAAPVPLLVSALLAGCVCLILPVLFPRYAFGLIWGCTALVLDPINAWLGRPSLLRALWNRAWRLPASFAAGGLFCGLFWEAWNYWSLPRWIYTIPYVDFGRVFEMPLLGYGGYVPFGLEVFAMVNFLLPLLRLGTLTLDEPHPRRRARTGADASPGTGLSA